MLRHWDAQGKMSFKKQVNRVSVNSQKVETKLRCQNLVDLLYRSHLSALVSWPAISAVQPRAAQGMWDLSGPCAKPGLSAALCGVEVVGESTHFMPRVRVFFCRRESCSPFSLLRASGAWIEWCFFWICKWFETIAQQRTCIVLSNHNRLLTIKPN